MSLPPPQKLKPIDTRPLESSIENTVCRYARQQAFIARKYKTDNARALPDRQFIGFHGKVFFIEFKRPGESPTGAQSREHKKLRDRGFRVYVIDNVKEGKRVIDQEAGVTGAPPV